jgi:hypothetical protein
VPGIVDSMIQWTLYQESQNVSVGLGLLDQPGSQVVGTGPFAELANVLRMQRDGLSSELVELITSQHNLGTIDSRREDSELGHISHLQARGSTAGGACSSHSGARSLRDDKGGPSSGGYGKSIDGRDGKSKEESDSLVGLHG